MRYIPVPNVVFTDRNGNSFEVKDRREIESDQVFAFNIDTKGESQLDAIAVRRDVFGPNGLTRLYQIFDFNITAIKEADFDLTKLQTLRIPV